MKTITNDPQDFIENGGWSFLEPDSSVSLVLQFPYTVLAYNLFSTSSALWKHLVNLLLQSFRSVSSDLHQC